MADIERTLFFLPFIEGDALQSTLAWPTSVSQKFQAMSQGISTSQVASGEELADTIIAIREELSLEDGSPGLEDGLRYFFDKALDKTEKTEFFERTLPGMANLMLKLPELVTAQAKAAAESAQQPGGSTQLALQLLLPQQPGFILLSQELAAAILAGSFFCGYPTARRRQYNLPGINFDLLFAYAPPAAHVEAKLRCLVHYFTRVINQMPAGTISFERKVLPQDMANVGVPSGGNSRSIGTEILPPLPTADFWMARTTPLCDFVVSDNGTIEDAGDDCLQVDFANCFLGGGVLGYGCVQEEIRFVLSPELIVGMLFLSAMEDNETIEIVGAERFSYYSGYWRNFRFTGNFEDGSPRDALSRRLTRIVAMDALPDARERQYEALHLLREVNKAFCGFLDHATSRGHSSSSVFQDGGTGGRAGGGSRSAGGESCTAAAVRPEALRGKGSAGGGKKDEGTCGPSQQNSAKIATGNWGCGAFGGDVEVKSCLQWLAASQAGSPSVHYFTFQDPSAARLPEIVAWVQRKQWTVGKLWGALVAYGRARAQSQVQTGFFDWLHPPRDQKFTNKITTFFRRPKPPIMKLV